MGKTIKELTEELEALKKENESLKGVISRVETLACCPISEAVQAMSKIRQGDEEIKKENDRLRVINADREDSIVNLKHDVDSLRDAVKHYREENKILSNVNIDRARLLGDQAATIKKLREENAEYALKIVHATEFFEKVYGLNTSAIADIYAQGYVGESVGGGDQEDCGTILIRLKKYDELKGRYETLRETVNKQADVLTYWHNFTLKYLEWPRCTIEKIEQGYYVEARASLNNKGFASFTKYEELKKFVRRNCVVAADADDMNTALEAEDWDKARKLVANYVYIYADKELVDEIGKLKAENDILKGKNRELLDKNEDAYAYIVNLENFFAKNHGYLDTDFEAIKQVGNTVSRHTDAKFENDILKGKNKELVNENYRLKNDYEMLKQSHWLQTCELSAQKQENAKLKERLNKVYGAGGDLDGDVIMLPGCKVSFNAKAGCYTFDIGGQHIVATNKGHIFIDKE